MATFGLLTWFKDQKTLTKLMLGFSAVGVVIVAVGIVGLLGLQQLRQQLRVVYESSTVALGNLGTTSSNLGLYHDAVLTAGRATRKTDFDDAVKPLAGLKAKTLAPLQAYATGQMHVSASGRDEAKDYQALEQALAAYFTAAEGAISAFEDSYSATMSPDQRAMMRDLGLLALSVDVSTKYSAATGRVRELLNTVQDVAKDLNQAGQAVAEQRTQVVLVGAGIAILVGGAIGFLLARFFSEGVTHIAVVAQQAASGNLQARAQVDSKDELGQMAASFNAMLDRITKLVQTEDERDQLQRRLMEFLVLVAEVSKGDLSKRGQVTADMFGNLADAFNLMLDRFGKLMNQVRDAAGRVNESAGALLNTAGGLTQTAQHQAEESTRTLKAVEGLTQSMRQVADTAGASSESAKQALTATERGRVAVQETVQDMQSIRAAVQRMSKQVKGLGDRSLEISQIVSTIRDIASQTNLLALNAAIEAAGAGEAGARFAVVADQVRKLAESSTQATKEIADLVKVIQTETQDAVVAMEQETQAVEAGSASALRTGDVFKEISQIAQRSAEIAQAIAESSIQQTAATEEVARTIKDITGGATATLQSADQTRQTVEEVAKLAEGLTSSVAQFKIA
ncbi:MAG: HAMP domain-containing protein [Nitrospirota bacterium]|nr:HAMP domain-containing protein [Nitrospirota bacterium]MDE3223802.1 HAMP domain-containing protein [Nitrospirota bacterium]MDE3241555.1 HAMP domain-containing protein [Nitrospirota bacterium]